MRRGAKPAKPKVESKPPIARKSPKNEGSRVRDLEKRLAEALKGEAEALEQQTATREILRVISSSPTDVQPVFDAIAQTAMRLCGAASSLVTAFDGELLHLCAQAALSPEGTKWVRGVYPRRPSKGFASGRAFLMRAIVQIPDVTADAEYEMDVAQVADFRSIVAVPTLRDGLPIGTINVHKAEPGPFTDRQVARFSRPSQSRPSSRSRMSACSTRQKRRSSSRRPQPRSCASSRAHRPTSSRSSTRLLKTP
jgi:hypothetical protein